MVFTSSSNPVPALHAATARRTHRRPSIRALFRRSGGSTPTARRVQAAPGSRTDALVAGASAPVNDLRLIR